MTLTVLYLPSEQAIPISAYQNMLVDSINDPDSDTPWKLYLEEATNLITQTGENYRGEHGHPTIKLNTIELKNN